MRPEGSGVLSTLLNYSFAMSAADMTTIRIIRGGKNYHTPPPFDKFERFVLKKLRAPRGPVIYNSIGVLPN